MQKYVSWASGDEYKPIEQSGGIGGGNGDSGKEEGSKGRNECKNTRNRGENNVKWKKSYYINGLLGFPVLYICQMDF